MIKLKNMNHLDLYVCQDLPQANENIEFIAQETYKNIPNNEREDKK